MPSTTPRGRRVALAAIIFGALCVAAVCQPVKSLPKPTDYVSDFAHVMSPAVIQKLDGLCSQVDREANAQIAVVTVDTTGDEQILEYSVDLYQSWGIGKKGIKEGSDRGVLILVAVKDRKRSIRTGYGLEGILPDATVSVIGGQMVPYLRNNDFDGAMMLAVGQISQIIAKDAGVTLAPLTQPQRQMGRKQVHLTLGQLVLLGLLFLFVIFFLARFGGSGLIGFILGMFMGGGFGGGGGGGGGGRDDGGGGFGGFGGGSTGGGGADGDW